MTLENSNRTDSRNAGSFESLIHQARGGDAEAAGSLIENYRNYLLLIANEDVDQELKAKVGASDVVQESMLHAQRNIEQFQGQSEIEWKSWLRTILGNDIRKSRRTFHSRKRDASREINIQERSAVGRGLLNGDMTPRSDAIQRETSSAINNALNQLSEQQQQVIRLRNFEQLGFEEIGLQMGRSADACRKMWARSIESLKRLLKGEAPELFDDDDS